MRGGSEVAHSSLRYLDLQEFIPSSVGASAASGAACEIFLEVNVLKNGK